MESAFEAFRRALLPLSLEEEDGPPALRDVLTRAQVFATAEGFALDLDAFAAVLSRHAAAYDEGPTRYLQTARPEDLALATACAAGEGRALAAFERLYFGEIERAFRRVRRDAVDPADFGQRVRERLFVATPERRPRIGDYAGTGELRTWFRVAVTRMLTSDSMRPKRDQPTEDEVLAELPGKGPTPELELLRVKYQGEFKVAFARSLQAMPDRDRAILRYTIVDQLGIDALSKIYDVHRATAARWVQRARDELVTGVRTDLEERLHVDPDELRSILRLVVSEVDISVRGLLPSELRAAKKPAG